MDYRVEVESNDRRASVQKRCLLMLSNKVLGTKRIELLADLRV